MTEPLLQKKLDRANARVALLEGMVEDKTRELYFVNENLSAALDYQRQIYRLIPESLLIAGKDGTIKEANESARTLLGVGEWGIEGESLVTFWPSAQRLLGDKGTRADFSGGMEQQWIGADGVAIPVLVSIARLDTDDSGEDELLCLATDIREQKSLEVELRHAQKLQSVGQLAAGVAHEINTPMQFIGDNVHFLRDSFTDVLTLLGVWEKVFEALPEGSIPQALLTELEDAADAADVEYLQKRAPKAFDRTLEGVTRVSGIVAAMKAFSHPQNDKAPTDLNQAIETTLTVARNEYKYIAEVELDLAPLPAVSCHAGDINQVLLNLIVNASHAISDQVGESGDKGMIRFRSRQDGDAVVISVEDSGGGIPEDVRERIFDPFFTTKEVGKGTGQGLALSRTIVVDKHGGDLTFETECGKGTTFSIRLPINAAGGEGSREAAA